MSTSSVPIPNIFTNEMFLRAAAGADWERVKIAMFAGDPENQPRGSWQGYPAASMLKTPHQDLNTYFSVGVQSGSSRGLGNFEKIFAVVLDDVGVKVDLSPAETLLGSAPSYVLETSPGNQQAGWFTDIVSRDWALGLTAALYQALGAGDNLKNVVGYMRLPVGTNWKAKYGAQGFRHRLISWNPGVRIATLDWVEIEKRIQEMGGGTVSPVTRRLSPGGPGTSDMPDPGLMLDDPILKVFRMLGRIQGRLRQTTMGWGYDVDCPWIDTHSERAREGAVYVPVLGRFHCHHGHCQDHTTIEELREKLDELLKRDAKTSMAGIEFDDEVGQEVEAEAGRVPPGTAMAVKAGFDDDVPVDLWREMPPPVWPGDIFDPGIEDTLALLAERDGLDPAGLGAVLMTTVSGAADKRVLLQPYAEAVVAGQPPWVVRPVLWLMLVAESGSRKTAILNLMLHRLKAKNVRLIKDFITELAAWNAEVPMLRGPRPVIEALLAEDVTLERLQEWQASNPRGLMYLRDELAALFDFGRYSGGNGAAERAYLLETAEGGPATVSRMTRTVAIENCALTILGGIQPRRLADFRGLADDGFLSRFAVLRMRRANVSRSLAGRGPDVTRIAAAIEAVTQIAPFGVYRTTPAGEAILRDLEAICTALTGQPDIGAGYAGFLGKLHGTAAKTALVLHLMAGGGDDAIPETTVRQATRYARFLMGHAESFYGVMPGNAVAQAVGAHLLRHPDITRITAGRLRNDVAACRPLATRKDIQDAVFPLVSGGWLRPATASPVCHAWVVRPGLADHFAERMRLEIEKAEAVKQAMNRVGMYR